MDQILVFEKNEQELENKDFRAFGGGLNKNSSKTVLRQVKILPDLPSRHTSKEYSLMGRDDQHKQVSAF